MIRPPPYHRLTPLYRSPRVQGPMQPDQRAGRRSLPDQRTLLSWLFIGRLTLAVGSLVGTGLVGAERPRESFLVNVTMVVALTFTAYGFYIVHWRGRRVGKTFLLIQAVVDLIVVTLVVHFAGQPTSAFPGVYVLVVAACALSMSRAAQGVSSTVELRCGTEAASVH